MLSTLVRSAADDNSRVPCLPGRENGMATEQTCKSLCIDVILVTACLQLKHQMADLDTLLVLLHQVQCRGFLVVTL